MNFFQSELLKRKTKFTLTTAMLFDNNFYKAMTTTLVLTFFSRAKYQLGHSIMIKL